MFLHYDKANFRGAALDISLLLKAQDRRGYPFFFYFSVKKYVVGSH